jgi:uncharacterized protein YaiI (UPF0178 family)
MRIFIDADACPKPIKEILYRAAIRTQTELILVANQYLKIPASPLIRVIKVSSGFDEADKRIVDEVNAGDLVITADIPLAAFVIEKGGIALNPRGRLYTPDTIKQQLAVRNLMEQLRDNQQISGGPASFNKLDCQALANQLDKLLANKK